VRNQGVLLRGINDTQKELLDLCFMLLDHGKIMPYYFYQCDMIPNASTGAWPFMKRSNCSTTSWIFAGVCHAAHGLRRAVRGQALGKPGEGIRPPPGHFLLDKNYRTSIEADDAEALTRRYEYYDPVYTLRSRARNGGGTSRSSQPLKIVCGSHGKTVQPLLHGGAKSHSSL